MSSVFYRQLGKGKPVILIHGFCETHEIWNDFADELSEKFEVFLVDLPGFGNSALPTNPFKIIDIARIILEWMDELKIQQPVIVGHSLGGYVALSMAKLNAEKIAGIVLFQSTIFADSEARKANRNKVIEFIKTHGTAPYIDTFVPGLFYDKKHPAIPTVDSIARKTSKETLLAYTAAMRDRDSSEDFVKSFNKPLLILAGEKDSVIPVETIEAMSQILPKASICLLNDTGHMAMYEQPSKALQAIEDFIARNRH